MDLESAALLVLGAFVSLITIVIPLYCALSGRADEKRKKQAEIDEELARTCGRTS